MEQIISSLETVRCTLIEGTTVRVSGTEVETGKFLVLLSFENNGNRAEVKLDSFVMLEDFSPPTADVAQELAKGKITICHLNEVLRICLDCDKYTGMIDKWADKLSSFVSLL